MKKKRVLMIVIVVILLLLVGCIIWKKLGDKQNPVPIIKEQTPTNPVAESGEVVGFSGESKLIQLTEKNYEKEVLQSDKIVVIEFCNTWSEDCKVQEPILEVFAAENPEVKIAKVDTDAEIGLKDYFGINAVPTIAIFKEGKIERKVVGVVQKEKLTDLINK